TYMFWSIPGVILAPIAGRIADRRRRSTMILIFGLAQVPLYIIYGLSNWFWLVASLYVVHGTIYAFVQPAVDSHISTASMSYARARILGLYSAFGLIGGFVGASGFSLLYSWNFHSPLFVIGIGYGLCVLIGGAMIRTSESKEQLLKGLQQDQDVEEEPIASTLY
ncbi:MAG TPA: MFS transporter, partial [Ktedonobacteraceae bacterium]|nr:MFS transporter [Ktedonobacteraceae bacterium]